MATSSVMSSSSSVEDGTSDVVPAINATGVAHTENDSQRLSTEDAANALLSMGPILPANPEDTTCYW